MKNYIPLIAIALFVLTIATGVGCGGGGGGSTSASGTGTSATGGTTADPNSTIVGRILKSSSTQPVPDIRVVFYDAGGAEVGQAISRANGSFDALLGTNAVAFSLDPTTIPTDTFTGYLREYKYLLKWYAPLIDTCKSALPPIVPGVQTTLPGDSIRLPPATAVPPFPNGCN